MVLVITQETFDDAVKENINEFELSPEDAVTEAINQFKAQGVDLSKIVTSLNANEQFENVNNVIKKLLDSKDSVSPDLLEHLTLLRQECDKGIQLKVHAGKNGAYSALLEILTKSTDKDVKVSVLKTLVSLTSKHPDILDDAGAQLIILNLDKGVDTEIQKQVLRWCRESCVMHEMNRQKLVKLNIVEKLTSLLKDEKVEVLKEVLSVLRALVLDDDVRVEFGRAHEHAKIIASENLEPIIELFKRFKSNEAVVVDLMVTISSMLVKTEFCTTVEEAGILELIQEVMTNYIENDKITRQCFKLLKALAGNDHCKVSIIQKGLAPIITTSLNTHKDVVATAAAGLNCIAAISLRSPDNSKALYEASLPDVIVECMRKHPNEKSIQRSGSWAIRNMVSRSRYQNKYFLELGAEEILQRNLGTFKEFEYDIKAALRDLECNVDLKEEWTGKGGAITTDAIKME